MKTTDELGLHGQLLEQQIDTSRRLVRAAMLGVPRTDSALPGATELLAAHALLTAFLAITKNAPDVTRSAAALAFDVSHELTATAEGHEPSWPVITP